MSPQNTGSNETVTQQKPDSKQTLPPSQLASHSTLADASPGDLPFGSSLSATTCPDDAETTLPCTNFVGVAREASNCDDASLEHKEVGSAAMLHECKASIAMHVIQPPSTSLQLSDAMGECDVSGSLSILSAAGRGQEQPSEEGTCHIPAANNKTEPNPKLVYEEETRGNVRLSEDRSESGHVDFVNYCSNDLIVSEKSSCDLAVPKQNNCDAAMQGVPDGVLSYGDLKGTSTVMNVTGGSLCRSNDDNIGLPTTAGSASSSFGLGGKSSIADEGRESKLSFILDEEISSCIGDFNDPCKMAGTDQPGTLIDAPRIASCSSHLEDTLSLSHNHDQTILRPVRADRAKCCAWAQFSPVCQDSVSRSCKEDSEFKKKVVEELHRTVTQDENDVIVIGHSSTTQDENEVVEQIHGSATKDENLFQTSSHLRLDVPNLRLSSTSSSGDGIGEEIANKLKKPNRRRRSFSLNSGCWSSKRGVLSTALRRLFRWGCTRENSQSRASRDLSLHPTISTLSNNVSHSASNAVPVNLLRNNAGNLSSPKLSFSSREMTRSGTSYKMSRRDSKIFSTQNSPALSVRSVKSVINMVSSASSISAVKSVKISPLDDMISLNSVASHVTSNSPPSSTSIKDFPFNGDNDLQDTSSLERSSSHSDSSQGKSASTNTQDSSDAKNVCDAGDEDKSTSFGKKLWRRKSSITERQDPVPPPNSSGLVNATPPSRGVVEVPAANESRAQHMRLVRSRRLMKEFRELNRACQANPNPVFSVALVNDCLYEWKVKLHRVDQDSCLHRDMVAYGVPFILLSLSFPDNFPFQPPFLRVLSPRIEKGFVMEGGAICMELLTPRGWASAYTVEAVIMQLAASLVKGQGRISRKPLKEFSQRAAEASFRSLVQTHDKYGWVTPPLAEG